MGTSARREQGRPSRVLVGALVLLLVVLAVLLVIAGLGGPEGGGFVYEGFN